MTSINLNLFKDFDTTTEFTENFSPKDVLSSIQDVMIKYYEILPNVKVRLWGCPCLHSKPLLLDVDKSVREENIKNGQCIVIETQKPDGSWSGGRSLKSNSYLSEITGNNGLTKPGLCGLVNLGNTCFMNSVLQCLSHCPPLSKYFLNNNYLDDLRPDGMEVDLCRAFGELLKAMWSGEYTDVSPTNFKWKVGKYASQFIGYQQHDAQEFLTFLLDGLNEAINRAKKEKPPPPESNHKPSNNESETREKPDQELAKEKWESYLRKSDSIIVDTFHGLLKSSVVCPVCETVSVTFDPLCYMTLPLPQDSDCVLKVLHVPYDQSAKIIEYRITASKFGTVRDVVGKVAERVNKNADSFILAEIVNNHFHKFFCLNDSIDKIDRVKINLMAYDVPVSVSDSQYTIVPVCHWETESGLESSGHSSTSQCASYMKSSLFGVPFVVVLPTTPCTYETIYKLIYERIGRYICNKSDLCGGGNVSGDSENGIDNNDLLFSLYIVNGQNPSEAKKIPNDNSLLKFPEYLGKQFLALQWTAKSRRDFYKCDSSTYQNLLNPQLKSKLQLQDCLSIFMSTEKLGANDTWNCPKCKVSRRATKKFDLWELPNVLIILLKRFTFNRGDTMGRGLYLDSYCREDKLNANVEFPMTNFNLNDYLINKDHPPVSYDLCGVINHYGTLSGGHYTAYAKHKEDKKWYCFDDSRVYPESEEKVMSPSAYILFYMQNNDAKHK